MRPLVNAAMPAIGSPEAKPVWAAHMPRDQNCPKPISLGAGAIGMGVAIAVPLVNVTSRIRPEVVGQGGTCARESQSECARCQQRDSHSRHRPRTIPPTSFSTATPRGRRATPLRLRHRPRSISRAMRYGWRRPSNPRRPNRRNRRLAGRRRVGPQSGRRRAPTPASVVGAARSFDHLLHPGIHGRWRRGSSAPAKCAQGHTRRRGVARVKHGQGGGWLAVIFEPAHRG